LQPSNGNVSAFIVLKGSPEENKMNGANIHSFLDLGKYDWSIDQMQEAFYKDPLAQRGCLITLTFPTSKDKLSPQHITSVAFLSEAKSEWFKTMTVGDYKKRSED